MSDLTVGMVFPRDDGYPAAKQPGGAGTPVTNFPQTSTVPQGVPEMVSGVPQVPMGLWVCTSGHWFNHWDVRCQGVAGVPSAFLVCPICSIIQRILTPFSLIYDDSNYILMA